MKEEGTYMYAKALKLLTMIAVTTLLAGTHRR